MFSLKQAKQSQSLDNIYYKEMIFNIIFNILKKKQKWQFNKDPSIALYTDLNAVL